MLIEDIQSGQLVAMDDVLAREKIRGGIARPARRTTALFSGSPATASVVDDAVVVTVPANTTDVDPRENPT